MVWVADRKLKAISHRIVCSAGAAGFFGTVCVVDRRLRRISVTDATGEPIKDD
jgi:hypothetical protein